MSKTHAGLAYRLDPEGESLANVFHLARAALAAYGDDAYSATPGISVCFPEHHTIVTRDVRGYAAANDRHVVVAFRGSTQEREWARGRHFGLVPAGPGRAHEGFSRLLESIWEPLLAILYDTRAAERHLWLTGHSAGGALALIATLRLEHLGFEPAMTAMFGSPRVLDTVAAASVRTPVYRVENADDPVPHVPWPSMGGYQHVGTAVRLMPTGAVAERRHSERVARRIDRVNELFEGRANSGMRHDHRMIEYVRKLAQYG
jgi:hypothetical protein